jgi:hypothetical protein
LSLDDKIIRIAAVLVAIERNESDKLEAKKTRVLFRGK